MTGEREARLEQLGIVLPSVPVSALPRNALVEVQMTVEV